MKDNPEAKPEGSSQHQKNIQHQQPINPPLQALKPRSG
jgi:hypothetical protein